MVFTLRHSYYRYLKDAKLINAHACYVTDVVDESMIGVLGQDSALSGYTWPGTAYMVKR